MADIVALLYADQSLVELGESVAGSPHSGRSGLTTLLQAKAQYDAGAREKAAKLLFGLIEAPAHQSRVKLWAAQALRDRGIVSAEHLTREVHGVVIEMPFAGKRDVLAVYRDGRAHFVSHAGTLVVSDSSRLDLKERCCEIIASAERIAATATHGSLAADSPLITVLTLNGPIVADAHSTIDELLRLAGALVEQLATEHAPSASAPR